MQHPLKQMVAIAILLCFGSAISNAETTTSKRVTIFHEVGKFAGWPATHGIWSWDDEILVGFSVGSYLDRGERHHINPEEPVEHRLSRSLDGGETWSIERPNMKGQLIPEGPAIHGRPFADQPAPIWKDFDGEMNFTHPDFAMTLRMTNNHTGPSKFYYSNNRGHDWLGPYTVPSLQTPGIAARTDYIPLSPDQCLVFLTAAKSNSREGRTLCALVSDSGRRWETRSMIGPEPTGFSIMPSTVRTGPKSLFTVVRRREADRRWIEAYSSTDLGLSWKKRTPPATDVGNGNPPSLVLLNDDRLCVTYGVRSSPSRIVAKLSEDMGETWSNEIVLRNGGSRPDIGYPATVQRTDGKIVTVYYFSDSDIGKEPFIEASIWSP